MPSAPDLAGAALDSRYELCALIGEGTFGRVYRGVDRRLRRTVAVKVIKPWWGEDPEWVACFEREAQLLARVNDPGIVQIFDVGQCDEGLYYVAEFVDGESLAGRVRRGALPWLEAVAIGEQLCRALAHTHARQIVHRDIKPANVLLTADGRVKVGDFSVARLAQASSVGLATIAGTPTYMAPEQSRGLPATPATDIYSAGVVLYEMLAGRPPFTADSPVELALRHIQQSPPPLPEHTPSQLEAIVQRALAKQAKQRFATAESMAQALAQVRREAEALIPPAATRGVGPAAGKISAGVPGGGGGGVPGAKPVGDDREPRQEAELHRGHGAGGSTRVAPKFSARRNLNPSARRRASALFAMVLALLALMLGGAVLIGRTVLVRVPDVAGLPRAAATAKMRRLRLRARFSTRYANAAAGIAISQVPAAGVQVKGGSGVEVVLSAGPAPVRMPVVLGDTAATATTTLQQLGLRPAVTQVPAPAAAVGTVTAQTPKAGSLLPAHAGVSLSVAQAPSWRVLTTFTGTDASQSMVARIRGQRWRVIYHMSYLGTCTWIFFCSAPRADVSGSTNGFKASFDMQAGLMHVQEFDSGPGSYRVGVTPGDDAARWSLQIQDYY